MWCPMGDTAMTANAEDRVLNTVEVAELWAVDRKTIVRWAQAGHLPSFKTPGGHWRYRYGDVAPRWTRGEQR